MVKGKKNNVNVKSKSVLFTNKKHHIIRQKTKTTLSNNNFKYCNIKHIGFLKEKNTFTEGQIYELRILDKPKNIPDQIMKDISHMYIQIKLEKCMFTMGLIKNEFCDYEGTFSQNQGTRVQIPDWRTISCDEHCYGHILSKETQLQEGQLYLTGNLNNNQIELLLEMGTVVYLDVSIDVLTKRLGQITNTRPLYTKLSSNQIVEKTKTLMKQRTSFFCKADFIVDGNTSSDDLVKKVIEKIH